MNYSLLALLLLHGLSCATTRVAVFCSADDKVSPLFKNAARELGAMLAQRNCQLVTGGSDTGLMKEVVDGYVL